MSLTLLDPRRYGSPLAVHPRPLRPLLVALALLSCAKAGNQPLAPVEELHYPAWLGTTTATGLDRELFVVNLDQDLAFQNGSVVSLDTDATPPPVLQPGAVVVPNMAGRLLVVDDQNASHCTQGQEFTPPLALVAGRTADVLVKFPLQATLDDASQELLDVSAPASSKPFGVGLTCSPDGTPRAWVSHQRGRDNQGYVVRLDLSQPRPTKAVVNTGTGNPRNFAYDADNDRLYITTEESGGKAPIRWITVGNGCAATDDGVQDERKGGCHVDPGFDLSAHLAGVEPNEIALSPKSKACTLGPYSAQSCRRMYLTVRLYDADQEKALGERPANDVGGLLVVLELPESPTLGGPDPQWVRAVSLGITAGPLLVIPRTGKRDLVVAAAVEDDVVMLYDDDVGAVVKVFARDPNTGVPLLGDRLAGLAARDNVDGTKRIFVSSYHGHWVSAIDVDPNDPASASIVQDSTGNTLHLGIQH